MSSKAYGAITNVKKKLLLKEHSINVLLEKHTTLVFCFFNRLLKPIYLQIMIAHYGGKKAVNDSGKHGVSVKVLSVTSIWWKQ